MGSGEEGTGLGQPEGLRRAGGRGHAAGRRPGTGLTAANQISTWFPFDQPHDFPFRKRPLELGLGQQSQVQPSG